MIGVALIICVMILNGICFSNFTELSNHVSVKVGDGKVLKGVGKGNVILNLKLPSNQIRKCVLKNVLYVPNLAFNLVSVPQIAESGNITSFHSETCKIVDKRNKLLAYGKKIGQLYFLVTTDETKASNCHSSLSTEVSESDELLWHRRFCHLGAQNLRKLKSKNMVLGLDFNISSNPMCEHCVEGKLCKTPFPTSTSSKIRKPFQLIHSDVCGKINPDSLGGGQYFLTFIDDSSRYCWVYVIKKKSDVFNTFLSWKAVVEKQYDTKIKILRTDNGGEYSSSEFKNYLRKEGIVHQKTVPKNPQQNGVAERYNRTIVETVRSMLSDSGLSKPFWGEALSTAVYTRNRSPTSALNDKTPYEVLNHRKPGVKHLKVFGCPAFSHIPSDERAKLDPKTRRCIFVGYSNVTKGYRMYDQARKKIFYSRDVVFCESKDNKTLVEKEPENANGEPIAYVPTSDNECNTDDEPALPNQEARYPTRLRKSPVRYGEWTTVCHDSSPEPKTVKDALNGPDSDKWHQAMQDEMDSLHSNKVWTLVEPPNNKKVVQCRWVFRRKLASDGTVGSYKARLVAKGYQQTQGIDYDETFSPVVRFESVRTVLALAAENGLNVHHMDFTSAFLNGDIDNEIYMSQPEGFATDAKLVCKLSKSLYGLKQSPKCWNANLDSFLKKLGFNQSQNDSCVYTKSENNNIFIIAVYVDDLILASKSMDDLRSLKSALKLEYKMKDLGKLEYFLGVNVYQESNKIFIHQATYTKSLIVKYGFEHANSVSTPADKSSILDQASDDSNLFDVETYQSAVGSLLYLCTRTRPNITYAVCNVAKFCSKPSSDHWSAVKRIFRYLRGTTEFGILYEKQSCDESNICVGYSDADWAGDRSDRKSTSGYCFKLSNGTCVALSTAEAEYVALASAAQEAVWISHLLVDLSFSSNCPMIINEDNQAAIAIAKNPKDHSKTKHVSLKYHFVRDMVNNNVIALKYCPTSIMLADIFTKPLASDRFSKIRSLMGMTNLC